MVWEDQNQNPNQVPRDIFERIFMDPRIYMTAFFAGILLWLLSGIYFVQEGEVGVIRRFGKEVKQAMPGINYHLPWPIEQRNIVNIANIRRAEIGFRSETSMGRLQRVISESLMLTGDENIVDAQMIIQYKVQDPSKFLFRLRDPEDTLYAASEVALRSVVGRTTIDEVLTTGRGHIQSETRAFLQKLMDDYQSGVQVTEVKLQVVDPPDQVKDAFHEVVRAREDRERLINQAKGYKEDLIPRARGQAQKTIRESEAYKGERVLKAQGDAARFLALYEEYQKAKQVTRDRLYLETMERILPKAPKFVVDPNVQTNIVPVVDPSAAYLGLLEAQPKPASNEAGSSKLSYPEFSVRGGGR
ncbi:MAG: HflK protein [Omnitrophica bacterium RIFCSPLOWO2_01_FULL_45_10]|nr:MAG: HflK protein [Omnitrophica bacterium RIFCSPLOWO2_01_FULL_45_10]